MPNPFQLLIVEDESIARNFLNDLLGREGYRILTAINGHEAIEHINQSTIDLILLDIGLPDMDGYQIMEYINSQSLDPLVIVMTGEGSIKSAVTALRNGAYDYLRKPLEKVELLTTIKNACNHIKEEFFRRELEEKLKQHNKVLEQMVAKQSIELRNTNEKLQQELIKRKKNQDALKESERRFRELAELLPETIFEMDLDGSLKFVNRAAFDCFGYTQQDFEGDLNALNMIAEGDRDKATVNIGKILAGEKIGMNDYTALRKDGSTFPAMIHSTPIIRKSKPIGLRGIIIDITDLKHAEVSLGESEPKYRNLMKYAPAGIYEADVTNGKFLSVNDLMCKYLGYSREELLRMNAFSILAEDKDRQLVVDRTAKILAGETLPLTTEYKLKAKDGQEIWAIVNTQVLREEGRPVKVQVVAHDISERKRTEKILQQAQNELELKVKIRTAELFDSNQQLKQEISERRRVEEELRHSEQRSHDLVENSLIGISIIQNNRFVYQNSEQKKLYNAASGKALVHDFINVHPEDLVKVKAACRSIMIDKVQSVEADFRFYPSGKVGNKIDLKWVQCRATRYKYKGEDAILLNAVDMTKTKQLEHQLIIRNKMLSLGRVAAGIAHEIRNPLTGINSYLYSLEEMCRSEAIETEDIQLMRQIVDQIQVASDKINLVIKRVMDFSKPGAPKMVLTSVNESIEDAIELSAGAMRKKGITIETSLVQDLPRCYADPHLIEQVVLNLAANAANAMMISNDSKIIKIGSYSKNNTVFIEISDSGPGVHSELKEKIFDPFFTTSEDGSGIGLNIVQRIVADHNGSIALDTSEWGGAKFIIELPIERRMHPR